MYLTAIIDWYSRMIVGFRLADSLENSHVIACMKDAIAGFIEKHNTVRLHESLDYQTPADVYGERFVQAA
ncbi:MAG: hypothetical protein LBS17_04460 [Actinomycetes bacterium]|jgi:transposase InsO family protein|nr:hypothetical protein [Actinomycetes bacterium]